MDRPTDDDEDGPDASDRKGSRQFVTALARGLDVLGAFVPDGRPLGNQEIAQRTGLPKPTVSRIAFTLTELGYLAHTMDGEKYRLGPRVLSLARAFATGTGMAEVVAGPLQALADTTRGTVALGQADGTDMVYLAVHRAVSRIILQQGVGSRIPVAFTAMGHAWLHSLPPAERDRALQRILPTLGPRRALFEQTLARTGEQMANTGFCVVCGLWEPDINGAATALRLADGHSAVALNIGGPAFWLPEEELAGPIGAHLMCTRQALIEAELPRLLAI